MQNASPKKPVPTFTFYTEQAQEFIVHEQWNSAIDSYKKALELHHNKPAWIYLSIGALLLKTGEVDEAIKCCEVAVSLQERDISISDKKRARAYLLLAKTLHSKQMLSEAILNYQKALKFDVHQPSWVYQKLADAFYHRTKEDSAQAAINYIKAMYLGGNFANLNLLNETIAQAHGSFSTDLENLKLLEALWKNTNSGALDSYEFSKHLIELGFLSTVRSPVNPSGYYFTNERLNLVYCSIPKNACTLFKRMLVDNSDNKKKFDDSGKNIHEFLNSEIEGVTGSQLLKQLRSSEYFKFTLLRNPFDRITSGYLDKFAKHRIPEPFVQEIIISIQNSLGIASNIEKSITFSQFIDYLAQTPDQALNDHWRPQHNFLAAVKFDFIGQFEQIGNVITALEDKFKIKVRRSVSSHITKYQHFHKDLLFHNLYPSELRELEGMPTSEQLYSPELRKKVQVRYAKDIELYEDTFHAKI